MVTGRVRASHAARSRLTKLQSSDDGDTLVEVLIALVIMVVVVIATLGGVATVVQASATHRAEATEETVLRSFAEDLILPPDGNSDPNLGYHSCATTSTYSYSTSSLGALPSGFATPKITSVQIWNGTSNPPQWESGSCTDHGLQQITITESTTSGSPNESITLLKADL